MRSFRDTSSLATPRLSPPSSSLFAGRVHQNMVKLRLVYRSRPPAAPPTPPTTLNLSIDTYPRAVAPLLLRQKIQGHQTAMLYSTFLTLRCGHLRRRSRQLSRAACEHSRCLLSVYIRHRRYAFCSPESPWRSAFGRVVGSPSFRCCGPGYAGRSPRFSPATPRSSSLFSLPTS